MTEAEYVQKVREHARQQGVTLEPSDIRDSLPYALQAVGRAIAESGEYALQQREATVTLTSGVASLTAQTDILIDHIDTVLHPDIDGAGTDQYFSRIPDGTRADLGLIKNTMYPPYVIENDSLYLSMGNGIWPDSGDFPPDTAALKVTGSAMPTLSTLAAQFEDDLILVGANYGMAHAAAGV